MNDTATGGGRRPDGHSYRGGRDDRRYLISLVVAFCLSLTLSAAERDDWREKMRPIVPLGYVCRHVDTALVIDGKIDEAAWSAAEWMSDFVDIEGDAKPRPRFRTRTKILWDDQYLYIGAELEEPHVWATLTEHDSVIFHDPDFEVFIDPDGDTHAYSEIEINALNTTWDLLLEKPYQDGGPPRNDWEISGLKTAVQVRGTLNDPRDTDHGWTVEIAFPWKAFTAHARHDGAPHEGEQWRINFSRVEWKITTADGTYRKIPDTSEDNWVWSPQGVIDMHRPEMWGLLQFTRRPASEAVSVAPIPAKAARDRVLEVYYAQRDFFKAHDRWAATLEELGFRTGADAADGAVSSLALVATKDGYECRASGVASGRSVEWTIRQDRKLSFKEAPDGKPLTSIRPPSASRAAAGIN